LQCSPREFGYSQKLWDGKLFSHHLSNSPKGLIPRAYPRMNIFGGVTVVQ
jgi:hypothetical protein